ncbi:macro domain-containing protein [Halodesulfurarchaeum sp.]|uniref:macro domain-containing protein n=1 Tax=Halodesulfurarchaeum sp. TaxID=1980530 RepID=UPI001BC42FAF|nr:macro domain-containing protein [Halodesulfurarchaeum sp.]
MQFEVIQGDIAEQTADCLVNAAGTSLRMGSGVAGALRRRANGPINDAAMETGPIELGAVAVTDAFDLDAEYVIHAAAMPHYGDGQATAESIESATRNALERAEKLGCESMGIPALGCGVAGFPLRDGAEIIGSTIAAFEPDVLQDVRFIAYSDSEYETVVAATESLRERHG